MTNGIMRVLCKTCANYTKHEVLFSKKILWEDEESGAYGGDDYIVAECMGCESISFVIEHRNSDYFDAEHGQYQVIDIFPDRREGISGLKQLTGIPQSIKSVYNETLKAIEHNQPILAGIGIRAIIEAVCEKENSSGESLYEKIDSLKDMQVLSQASATILHKLRTLGNSAAHKIVVPEINQLKLAIDVVQNLLQEVYVFPKKAEEKLPAN